MNIAVCLKQTPDTTTRVQIAADGASIVEDGIQWVINPYDESAIEQALQLTEQHGGEVTIVSLGPSRVEKSIRDALAMGAHKAIRLDTDRIPTDPAATAHALAQVIRDGGFDLVLTGQQAIDDDNGQVPSYLGQLLGWAAVTGIEALQLDGEQGTALREFEGGRAKVSFRLPAVLGVNRRLNDPRYPSFKNIMQAKKKPIEVQETSPAADQVVIEHLSSPPEKPAGRRFDTGVDAVPELVRLLHEEAKVI